MCPGGLRLNGGAKQDGLEGMAGTFAAGGVQCESCHGPGSEHADSPSSDNIVKDDTRRCAEGATSATVSIASPRAAA